MYFFTWSVYIFSCSLFCHGTTYYLHRTGWQTLCQTPYHHMPVSWVSAWQKASKCVVILLLLFTLVVVVVDQSPNSSLWSFRLSLSFFFKLAYFWPMLSDSCCLGHDSFAVAGVHWTAAAAAAQALLIYCTVTNAHSLSLAPASRLSRWLIRFSCCCCCYFKLKSTAAVLTFLSPFKLCALCCL